MAHSRDTSARVVPLRIGSLDRLHPKTASGVFWELDPLVAGLVSGLSEADPQIDKEAWLVASAFNHEPVGFSIIDAASETGALATILYCPAADAPGAVRMPTAPVSKDAWIVTSLHIDEAARRRGWEAVLLDSVIGAATSAGVSALEVFGVRAGGPRDKLSPACAELVDAVPQIGLTEVSILESAGFKVAADHPAIPRLRLTLPPDFDLLTAHEIADLLAEVPAQ